MSSPRTALFVSALLAALLSGPALAQVPASPTAPAASAAHAGPGMHHAGRDGSFMRERMQRRIGEFKSQLKLTPPQEPAWAAFVSAVQPQGGTMARPSHGELEKMTTPERIDRMQAVQAQRAANMGRRATATKTLYATLTPEQQKTFDDQSLRFLRKHGRGHGEGHHGHGGGYRGG